MKKVNISLPVIQDPVIQLGLICSFVFLNIPKLPTLSLLTTVFSLEMRMGDKKKDICSSLIQKIQVEGAGRGLTLKEFTL